MVMVKVSVVDSAGLPVGLQIVGRAHDDVTVLRAARAYESVHPVPRPQLRG